MGDTVYTYREALSDYDHPTIFACVAIDILEADKICEEHCGMNPAKTKYIGCSFVSRYNYL